MAMVDGLVSYLVEQGWEDDLEAKVAAQQLADSGGMSALYPYNVIKVLKKGEVKIVLEQNTSAESAGGLTSVIEHPPVVKISGPGGRSTVSAHDIDAIEAVAASLA